MQTKRFRLTTIFLPALAVLAASVCAAGASALGAPSTEELLARRVDLEWVEVPKAKLYELEVATDPEFTVPIISQKLSDIRFSADLLPGAYYYRVRAIDGQGFPGIWSATQDLNINPRPPQPISPADGENVQGNLPDTGLPMKWKSSGPGIRYLIEIHAQEADGTFGKIVVKQEVSGTEFPFFPQDVGKYQWTLHTLGAGGDEAGVSWGFNIEGVVPRDIIVEPGTVPKRIVRFVPPWWRGHWTLVSRYGQAGLSYSIVDLDLRASGSFSGLTGYVSETLHWEWHDPVDWTRGGVPWIEVDVELDRQTVLSESVVLPRHTIRVGSWYERWIPRWRFSPVLEFGDRELAVYQPRSPTDAARSNSVRKHLGLGVSAEFRLLPFLKLGGSALLKFESGGLAGLPTQSGSGDQLDTSRRAGNLLSGNGLEFQLKGILELNSILHVEGRVRYEHSPGSWVPVFGSSPGNPTSSTVTEFGITNVSFDAGVGLHF